MKEVKKCSISGIAFTLDTDAYEVLENYLKSLKDTYEYAPDGAEIVADIEARIAELILSTQDNARVVERPLIENIVKQLGSAEDITGEDPDNDLRHEAPRIPRRLYRDIENAKLSGVCAGIGRYFDVDPVWIRLGIFVPLLLCCFQGLPLMGWLSAVMGNLFAVFLICYVIMWFAVPPARSARQKLEMNGEKITEQSIRDTAAAADPDTKARSIVAETVSVFGKIVLICMKLFAGLIVFGLIMGACALIIGLFAVVIGGSELQSQSLLQDMSIWLPILGILTVLIPMMLLIYVLMCLIASRKPGGKTVLVIFLLWLAGFIALASVAIREDLAGRIRRRQFAIERTLNTAVVIDSDTTTLRKLLRDLDDKTVTEESGNMLRISVPSKSIDITVDKKSAELKVNADGKEVVFKAENGEDGGSVTVRREHVEKAENGDTANASHITAEKTAETGR